MARGPSRSKRRYDPPNSEDATRGRELSERPQSPEREASGGRGRRPDCSTKPHGWGWRKDDGDIGKEVVRYSIWMDWLAIPFLILRFSLIPAF